MQLSEVLTPNATSGDNTRDRDLAPPPNPSHPDASVQTLDLDASQPWSDRLFPLHRDGNIFLLVPVTGLVCLETHGPLGTLWVGLGLSGFYIALIWINTLLGVFLTPLFLLPATWFIGGKKREPKAPPV